MMAQGQNNSWSELLTSDVPPKSMGFTEFHKTCFTRPVSQDLFTKPVSQIPVRFRRNVSNPAQHRRGLPVMVDWRKVRSARRCRLAEGRVGFLTDSSCGMAMAETAEWDR